MIVGSSLPGVPRPKVHDAALRTRLLECAGATLPTGGLAALSLRTLAADVGTSTTAIYALFGGKPGLLQALHAEAIRRFAARLERTVRHSGSIDINQSNDAKVAVTPITISPGADRDVPRPARTTSSAQAK